MKRHNNKLDNCMLNNLEDKINTSESILRNNLLNNTIKEKDIINNINKNENNITVINQYSEKLNNYNSNIENYINNSNLEDSIDDNLILSEYLELSNYTIESFTDSNEFNNNHNEFNKNEEINIINKESESLDVFILNNDEKSKNEIEESIDILENVSNISYYIENNELEDSLDILETNFEPLDSNLESLETSLDSLKSTLYISDNELDVNLESLETRIINSTDIFNNDNINRQYVYAGNSYVGNRYINNTNIVELVNEEELLNRRIILDRYLRQLNDNIRRRISNINITDKNDFMDLIEISYNCIFKKYISRIELNLQNFKIELKDCCTYIGDIRHKMIDKIYFGKFKYIIIKLINSKGNKMDNLLKEIVDLGSFLSENEIDYLTFILIRDFKLMGNKNYGIINLLKKVHSLIYGKLAIFFLPKKLYKSVRYGELINITDSTCIICLVNYNKRSICVITDCLHIFHAKCMKIWLKSSLNCPKCREKPTN